MAKALVLRALVEQRLSAAVEEIFVLFERTITEYEEELCRSEQERERQKKLLDAVLTPHVLLQRTDDQQLQVEADEFSPVKQEWICSLDQEDPPEPPHIKEEQEQELWTSLEQEQLQGLKETEVTFTPVPVKSEGDEEYSQASQLRQSRTENEGAEPPASSSTEHMITGTDGEDCGGPGPELDPDLDRCLGPDTDVNADGPPDFNIEISNDQDNDEKEMKDLNSVKNIDPIFGEITGKNTKTSASCSVCGKIFARETDVGRHMASHTEERPYSCSVCGKTFRHKRDVGRHMVSHTDERPYSCSVCGKTFRHEGDVGRHMVIHTDEKPFSCSVCGKTFRHKRDVGRHMVIHTEERPYSCSVCGKTFRHERYVGRHMACHTEEKPYSCSVCGKAFRHKRDVGRHMVSHTEEKPFSCLACGKTFKYRVSLTQHMTLHTGEILAGSFKSSTCGKTFFSKDLLKSHMMTHTGEKPFSCSQCGKTFGRNTNLKAHMRVHTGEKRFSCSVCHKRFRWNHQVKRHVCVSRSAECGGS